MKLYVINLKRRSDRLERVLSSFEQFGFTNFEIIEAMDGREFNYDMLSQLYNKKRAMTLQRELTVGEVCTALSHQKAYDRIMSGDESHGVVIEDDCPITQELIDFCNQPPVDLDIVLLGYYTSNENSPCPVYKPQTYQYQIMDICSDSRVYFTTTNIQGKYFEFDMRSRTVDFLHGGHCYMISKQGCETLLKFNRPVMVEADNVWNFKLDMKMYGIRPMLVEISRNRWESDLEQERKLYQDTYPFCARFLRKIRSGEFGT